MKKSCCTFLLLFASFASASETVLRCDVGAKTMKRVEVVRDLKIGDTDVYYLSQGGKALPFFETPDGSRGSDVHMVCAGNKHRALVVSGEFTSNFLQGFALIYNPVTRNIERLDFAEKSSPAWLYLGTSETLVVLPTHGYGETNKKYVVYRHALGSSKQAETVGTDTLPAAGRFEVIKLE